MTDETKGEQPAMGPFDSDSATAHGVARGLTNYGDKGFSLFLRKAFIKGAGLSDDALARPIIGIVNTGSSYNPCHGNAPQLIEAVKRGVMLAGGLLWTSRPSRCTKASRNPPACTCATSCPWTPRK